AWRATTGRTGRSASATRTATARRWSARRSSGHGRHDRDAGAESSWRFGNRDVVGVVLGSGHEDADHEDGSGDQQEHDDGDLGGDEALVPAATEVEPGTQVLPHGDGVDHLVAPSWAG